MSAITVSEAAAQLAAAAAAERDHCALVCEGVRRGTQGFRPAASAAQASGKKAGGAAKPASHDLTVRRDTPSSWAAFCWV